jgi:hypothetical protein
VIVDGGLELVQMEELNQRWTARQKKIKKELNHDSHQMEF